MKRVWVVETISSTYSKRTNDIVEKWDNTKILVPYGHIYRNLIDAETDIIKTMKNNMSGKFVWLDGHFNMINEGRVKTCIIKDYEESYVKYEITITNYGIM